MPAACVGSWGGWVGERIREVPEWEEEGCSGQPAGGRACVLEPYTPLGMAGSQTGAQGAAPDGSGQEFLSFLGLPQHPCPFLGLHSGCLALVGRV